MADSLVKVLNELMQQYGGGALGLHSVAESKDGDRLCVYQLADKTIKVVLWRKAANETVEVATVAAVDAVGVGRVLLQAGVAAQRVGEQHACLCAGCVEALAPDNN